MRCVSCFALAGVLLTFWALDSQAAQEFIAGSWRGTLLGKTGVEDVELTLSVRDGQVRGQFVWIENAAVSELTGGEPTRRTFFVTRGVKKDDIWVVGFEGQVSKKRLTAGFKAGKTNDDLVGVVEGLQGQKDRAILMLNRVGPLGEIARGLVGTWKGSAQSTMGAGTLATYRTDALTLELREERGRLRGTLTTKRAKGLPTTSKINEIRVKDRSVTFDVPAPMSSQFKYALVLLPGEKLLVGSSVGGILSFRERIRLEKGLERDIAPTEMTPGSLLPSREPDKDEPKPLSAEERTTLIADLTRAPWRGELHSFDFDAGGRQVAEDRVLEVTFRAKDDAVEATMGETFVDPDSPEDARTTTHAEHTVAVRFHGPRDLRFSIGVYWFRGTLDHKGRLLKGNGEYTLPYGGRTLQRNLTLERGLDLPLEPGLRIYPKTDPAKRPFPDWRVPYGKTEDGPPKPPTDWRPPEEERPDPRYVRGTMTPEGPVHGLLGTWIGTVWHEAEDGKRRDIPVDVEFAYRGGRLFGSLIQPGVLQWRQRDDWFDLRLEAAEDGRFRFAARNVLPWKLGDPEHDVELRLDAEGVLRGPIRGWPAKRPDDLGYDIELRRATPATEADKALVGTWRGRVPSSVYKHEDYILRFELRRGRLIAYVPFRTHLLDLYPTTPIRELRVADPDVFFYVPSGTALGDSKYDRAEFALTLHDGELRGTVKSRGKDYPVEFKRE